MTSLQAQHSVVYDDPKGIGVAIIHDGTAVYDAFHRRRGDTIFRDLMVVSGSYVNGIVAATCLDTYTGELMSFAHRTGDIEFMWNNRVYILSQQQSHKSLVIGHSGPERRNEQLLVCDDILIVVRSNYDDHKDSNRRMYIGNEDGTAMSEVPIQSFVVYGDKASMTYVTSEGILVARPLLAEEYSEWNGVRMYHCEQDDFIIDESVDGRIMVGLKWQS